MASLLLVFLACSVAPRVLTHSQKLYQPYGPKMCEALYHNQADFTAWDFDKEDLVCKLSGNTAETTRHATSSSQSVSTETKKTDKPFNGFLMFTISKLFLVDIPMNTRMMPKPFEKVNLRSNLYAYDNGILYRMNIKNGRLFQGVIDEDGVTFQSYKKFKGPDSFFELHVDDENKLVVLFLYNGARRAIFQRFNITTKRPRKLGTEHCSSWNVVLDKQNRIIFYGKKEKLSSMDYLGNNRRTFEHVRINYVFSLDFQDEHILCIKMVERTLVKYRIINTSKEVHVKRIPLRSSLRTTARIKFITKVKGLVLAIDDHSGLLVMKGHKCRKVWKDLVVRKVVTMD